MCELPVLQARCFVSFCLDLPKTTEKDSSELSDEQADTSIENGPAN